MKIEVGIPGLLKIVEEVPSLAELIQVAGPITENPLAKSRRVSRFLSDYPKLASRTELSGTLRVILADDSGE